ncbi:MAG TPA: C1 family peptidase [Candidatus Baltobacteraceae bacterium]|nr:C1 family peptidase [Candidatus Baltobacteraceae bacterium]
MAGVKFHPGSRRDEPDARDRRFRPSIARLPRAVDLSAWCGEVYQQRHIQSCSANALASTFTLIANRDRRPIPGPSRLFMYFNARKAKRQQQTDCGTTLRTAIKAAARFGACPERMWRYLDANVLATPPHPCYAHAHVRPASYRRIARNLDDLYAALAQRNPFVFGVEAYVETFSEAAHTGVLRLPRPSDRPITGHALICVGYDRAKKRFLARNSLGKRFADDGFFWIPEAYFIDRSLTFDFWIVSAIATED